jgi:hypothetical protein
VFANERYFQDQLDASFARVNARQHRSIRARPIDRLAEKLKPMAALPHGMPDCDRRWVLRVAADPDVRFDTGDHSLNPDLVGQRVEMRVSDQQVVGVVLDTGELACRHTRRSHAIARSPRSSMPGHSSAAAVPPTSTASRRCRSARSIATTR